MILVPFGPKAAAPLKPRGNREVTKHNDAKRGESLRSYPGGKAFSTFLPTPDLINHYILYIIFGFLKSGTKPFRQKTRRP